MKNKKILITGGAGFIGHHVIFNLLKETNYEIISIDRLDYSGSYNRIEQIINQNDNWKKRVSIIWHDLKAEINPLTAKKINEPNIVLHLAAASHVDRSIDDPMSFVLDNVVGTVNLLNYSRNLKKLEKFVYFSTDEVFGPAPLKIKYKENDRYNSGNPYAASKAGAEEMCVAFKNTYDMPIIITHTMNVFGERQHPEKYLPKIINCVLNKKTLTIHSNRNKTKAGSRFYIHAQDVADAINFILKNGKLGEKYNIVGSKELDNYQLALIISNHLDKKLKYKFVDFHSSRPGHDLRYALSGAKLKKMGWQPRKNIEQRIKDTVDWTIQNKEWL
jgi:dTDP-glucose 4,6-dehydratase